jgi:SAM-dependent methyltransferase
MGLVRTLKRIVPRKFHRQLGVTRRWLRTIPPQVQLQKKRMLSDLSLSQCERDLLSKASNRIYCGDMMYDGNAVDYYRVGLSAISCINEAVELAGLTTVRSILDLPCGSGRVLRFLVHRFPEAEITACELERGPVEFCEHTFGALPAYSSANLSDVSLGKEFDLIWCGSLVTHLNDRSIRDLFRVFKRHLSAGGLLIFTTHGDFVSDRLPKREFDYMLTQEQFDRVCANYPVAGYAFEDYLDTEDWGVSLTSPEWIRQQVSDLGGLQEVFFKERGWDNHQDVFGFVRM